MAAQRGSSDDLPMASPGGTARFPTFLDEDPFPSPIAARPTSSAASDATSDYEFGASKRSEDGIGQSPGSGPTREIALQTIRPDTSGSSHPPPSRRGWAALSRKDGDGSRPGSAVSKTHVPSLMAQGFARPMSSQKLQVQRGQSTAAASSLGQTTLPSTRLDGGSYHRYSKSNASMQTNPDLFVETSAEDVPSMPTTQGTQGMTFTNPRDIGVTTVISGGKPNSSNMNQGTLNTPQQTDPMKQGRTALHPNNSSSHMTTRSNRSSLRASLGLASARSSKRDIHDRRPAAPGHERLPSTASSPVTPAKEKPSIPSRNPPKKNGKNYQYFAGNLLFFCSGRCLNTKAKPLNIATLVLTALPAGLFFGFSAPWLWFHVSPALPVVFASLFFLAISSLLHAAFSDPGILPRNLHPHPPNPEEDRDPLTVGPATTEWVMVKTFPSRKQISTQSAAENGSANGATAMEVPTKYCKTCRIWRPARAHHCRTCDACMETQDHHCVWLNNCVGRRNYRYFFSYVAFASVLSLCLIAFSLLHVGLYAQQHHISFGASLSGRTQERVAFALFVYTLLALPYPGSLFLYHLFLIARGESTREYLNSHKFSPKDRHRPFSQANFFLNWITVLVRPRPPSYMSFKRRHIEGDARLGHTLTRKERQQKAKQEASAANNRVHGMKNRFSVPGTSSNANHPSNGNGVEMKQLSPRFDAPGRRSNVSGASRPMDSTPR